MAAHAHRPGFAVRDDPDGFDLFVFRHPLAGARDLLLTTHGDETLWWPQDRSWVYARPVDSDALYIACERPLAAALVNGGFAGAREVRPTDPTWTTSKAGRPTEPRGL